jgi:serpin B
MAISAKQRQVALPFESARVPQLVEANTTFAFDLYQSLYYEGQNLVFSPYSLSVGLSMAYVGARGETEEQMAAALNFELPQEQLHPAFNALDQSLGAREGAELLLANAMWGSISSTYLETFLDTLAENYGTGVHQVDFSAPAETRQRINQWVGDQTEDRIPELLPSGSIQREVDLILTNAIYFQAPWANPFPEEGTQEGTFTRLDGESIPVAMMNQTAQFRYGQVAGVQVIELPYEGGRFSMLILLPEAGTFETFASNLEAASLEQILALLHPAVVQLSLPKFQFEFGDQLKDALIGLGMVDAFGDADFSGIDGSHELFIDQIYHQAVIGVDEAGTEVTGGSAVVIAQKGVPEVEVTLTVDQPFLFMIRDNRSGALLFLGHVLDPRK